MEEPDCCEGAQVHSPVTPLIVCGARRTGEGAHLPGASSHVHPRRQVFPPGDTAGHTSLLSPLAARVVEEHHFFPCPRVPPVVRHHAAWPWECGSTVLSVQHAAHLALVGVRFYSLTGPWCTPLPPPLPSQKREEDEETVRTVLVLLITVPSGGCVEVT